MTTDPCCNKVGIDAVEDWMASRDPPRKVYCIGPQLPVTLSSSPAKTDPSGLSQAQEAITFLNSSLKSHGVRSVVYVSS
jgi:hypothetical protein